MTNKQKLLEAEDLLLQVELSEESLMVRSALASIRDRLLHVASHLAQREGTERFYDCVSALRPYLGDDEQ